MKSYLLFASLSVHSVLALGATPACRVDASLQSGTATTSWQGPCKDGWADGVGVLEKKDKGLRGWRYEGAVQLGLPHGHGFMKSDTGDLYEGAYVAGRLEGMAIHVIPGRERYDGSFKEGQRHGVGSVAYTLGGRYDGFWKDDLYNGRGVIEYPGGRKLDTTFVAGQPAGQTAREVATAPFKLTEETPTVGSMLARPIATSDIPLNKRYEQMTIAERNNIKARYPLMDDQDDPPFPIDGMAAIYRGLAQITTRFESRGALRVVLQIDAEGNAMSAKVYAAPDAGTGQALAQVLMLTKYKPAKCDGKPCPMAFPFYTEVVMAI